MNCRCVTNLISAYVGGELTGAQMLEIRRHLSDCPECAGEHEMMRAMKSAVSRLGTVSPPEHLAASIVAKLDDVSIPPYQRIANRLFGFAGRKLSPVAAALAVSGLALAILASSGQDRMLVDRTDAVATAPLSVHVESVSFQPQIPDTPITYSSSKPLVVADYSKGPVFQIAGMH